MKFGLNIKRKNVFEQAEEEKVAKKPSLEKVDKKTLEILSQAIEQDSDIFEYDKAYETFSSTRNKKTEGKREARYIHGLIQASNKRKIDLEIAQEKKIQRERQQEGELFKDKEKFVTQAYLEKQLELQRLEQEEREREAREKKDFSGFYRKILDERTLESHQGIQESEKGGKIEAQGTEDLLKGEKEVDVAIKQAIASGKVVLNDSEEIVDKRLYLKGGLNFTKKAEMQKVNVDKSIQEKRIQEKEEEDRKRQLLLASRRRSELKSQKLQVESMKESEKSLIQETLKKSSESSVSQSKILDAKARYLERKKLKE